ncbi:MULTISPECIES: hypothetical protein [Flavobacteriaceae]|uniref:hypothetical protein n=1 Tax=Flavobacteriaceae TaxID=49546 RepID=UPI001491FB1F|nr:MULTISPECIES: hypothetical protein [Allomuricauda]MDC6364659.1 hypothetical protein [Muricauda sp. AC10]
MGVIKEIIQKSAIGHLSNAYKSLVISLFVSIVGVLMGMFITLMINGFNTNIQFGY